MESEAKALQDTFAEGLGALGIETGGAQLERWVGLARLLERWGRRMNLTGHRTSAAIAGRLLLEAAALSRALPPARRIADLGSGAGIPGLPLALCRPEAEILLIESRERRHHFQRTAIRELGLSNAQPLRGRAEELEPRICDGVIAQAVARPDRALVWMRPWMDAGGWAALATNPEPPPIAHPDLDPGTLHPYAAPGGGPPRAVWIGRLRSNRTQEVHSPPRMA